MHKQQERISQVVCQSAERSGAEIQLWITGAARDAEVVNVEGSVEIMMKAAA